MSAEPGRPPPEQLGDYALLRRLAVGGTAEVFLGHDRRDPRQTTLVIKRLLPVHLADPTMVAMFVSEARIHRVIEHPNVVRVLDAGVADGEPFLVLSYVEGIDLSRLARRAEAEARALPLGLAIYVARSLTEALEAVHTATGDDGQPLGVVHRDVTPSNVYLSSRGEVVLGDFGIAKTSLGRQSRASMGGALKGKYAYLAPEQVGGEPADRRADLFSLAVVLSELLLGRPLFEGAGQLAVLLAIRDGRIDRLAAIRDSLPDGLFDVLSRALAREPAERFQSARELGDALAPFEGERHVRRAELCEWVAWARDTNELARKLKASIRESSDRLRAVAAPTSDDPAPADDPPTVPRAVDADAEPATQRFDERPSRVRFARGGTAGPIGFAQIIAMVVTGEVAPDDEVDLMGEGFRRVSEIELLVRHLPDETTTRSLSAPTPPDLSFSLGELELLEILGRLARRGETGALLVSGPGREGAGAQRREIYLKEGKLFHVVSSEPGDLLGQTLVRRGVLSAGELDMALAVLSRFQGRLGDTLIGLGLIDGVALFREIEEQGKDRLARAFGWRAGQAAFHRGVLPQRVEFPLDLDMAPVLLAGAEASLGDEAVMDRFRARLGVKFRRVRATTGRPRPPLPRPLALVLESLGAGMELRQLLLRLGTTGALDGPGALRALGVALALGLAEQI